MKKFILITILPLLFVSCAINKLPEDELSSNELNSSFSSEEKASSFDVSSTNEVSSSHDVLLSSSSDSNSLITSYEGTYYQNILFNEAKETLIKDLSSLMNNTASTKSYASLWEGYKTTDIYPGTNIVWDMYSNTSYVVGSSSQGAAYSKEGDSYNREHSIPQSWFNEASPMKSDIFHIYPTDGYVNNKRSNYPYGEVGKATYTSSNGCKLGTSSNALYSGIVFEPCDEYKGDFARTYFYMATRYYTKLGSWSGEGKKIFQGSYPYLTSYALNLFLKWAKNDPVSEKEIIRNEACYLYQGNRNPFIDYNDLAFVLFDENYQEETISTSSLEKINQVIASIDQIGNVTLASESLIIEARTSYDSLDALLQSYVTNYQTLLEAETTLALLKEDTSALVSQEIITFLDQDFSNAQNIKITSSITPFGFDNTRGVQFLMPSSVTLTLDNLPLEIKQVKIIATSNSQNYQFKVNINNVDLVSEDNTLTKIENKEIIFTSSEPLRGIIKIQVDLTSSNPKKSLYIKSISLQ